MKLSQSLLVDDVYESERELSLTSSADFYDVDHLIQWTRSLHGIKAFVL